METFLRHSVYSRMHATAQWRTAHGPRLCFGYACWLQPAPLETFAATRPSSQITLRKLVSIIRPRRSRVAAAYIRQTLPWTICRSVGPFVCRSVGRSVDLSSVLWQNGGSDPDAVWHHRSDGSMDEAGSGV